MVCIELRSLLEKPFPSHVSAKSHDGLTNNKERFNLCCEFRGRLRYAAVVLLMACLMLARLTLVEQHHVVQSEPPKSVVDIESVVASGDLSNKAWQDLLDQFRQTLQKPKYEYRWLSVIIRDDEMWVVKEHATTLAKDGRFQSFSAMMRRALQFGRSFRKKLRQDRHRSTYLQLLPLLDKKMKHMAIPLLMYLGDTKTCSGFAFPRFGWCSLLDGGSNCVNFALPSYSFYRDAPNKTPSPQEFYQNKEKDYPWSSKKPQAVWRGSASGHNPFGWEALPRAQLVNVSIHHPELLDAAFTQANQYAQIYPEEGEKLRNFSRFGDWIHLPHFQKYRAVVDIDGNSWSDRFGNLLCLNSVVIKVQPANQNYFFPELRPWVHYIPVTSNMSDIVQALTIAVSNVTEVTIRAIVHRANEWCRLRATKERFAQDTFWILNSYVRLIGTDQTRWSQWQDLFEIYERNVTLQIPTFE